MPWLMAETKKIIDKKVVARLLLDGECIVHNYLHSACMHSVSVRKRFIMFLSAHVILS